MKTHHLPSIGKSIQESRALLVVPVMKREVCPEGVGIEMAGCKIIHPLCDLCSYSNEISDGQTEGQFSC